MPWYNGDFPPSYKNQPKALREKAVEIANQLLKQGTEEGIAIATGLKRARILLKEKGTVKDKRVTLSSDKKYIEAFHDYDEYMLKKRQYARAIHIFHDQTADYNEKIDNLSVKEMETMQKEFLKHERNFHDVMDSFERALDAYKKTISELQSLKTPIQIQVRKKNYIMQITKGEIAVKEI